MKESKVKRVIAVKAVKVQKWGNSLGVRLPAPFVQQLNITEGSDLDIILMENEMTLRPVRTKPTLEELLAGITEQNKHGEIDFGRPEGNEYW